MLHEHAKMGQSPAVAYLQDCIATVGEPLCVRSVPPGITSPRATVNIQYHGQLLWLGTDRERQVGRQLQAIPSLDHFTAHVGQLELGQRWLRHKEELCLLGVPAMQLSL